MRAVSDRGVEALPKQDRELDLRALGASLWRKKARIIVPGLIAAGLSLLAVNIITPKYKSEARLLIEGRENIFLRPDAEKLSGEARDRVDLGPAKAAVVTNSRIRQFSRSVLLNKTIQYPGRGVALLPWCRQILPQHRVDRGLEPVKPRRRPHPRLLRRRFRRSQRLPHRRSPNVMTARKLSDRELLHPRITPNRREHIHPRSHPKPPPSASGTTVPSTVEVDSAQAAVDTPSSSKWSPLRLPWWVRLTLP